MQFDKNLVQYTIYFSIFFHKQKINFISRTIKMGFWSMIRKIIKKIWQKVKAIARTVIRIIFEIWMRIINMVDLVFGFMRLVPKKLHLHVIVLSQLNPIFVPIPTISSVPPEEFEIGKIQTEKFLTSTCSVPVANSTDLTDSIDYAKKILKEKFNVELVPHRSEFVHVDTELAPDYALNVGSDTDALDEEYGNAGEFYAGKMAGWNCIRPLGAKFPITVFVVVDVKDKRGCSLGPLTDYVTIDPGGLQHKSTLVHEIAHSCGLWHSDLSSNIMFHDATRGSEVKWFQYNILRSSRHVLYW